MHVQDAKWIPGASNARTKLQGGLGQVGTNATASLASPKNLQATQWPFQSGESAKEGIQEEEGTNSTEVCNPVVFIFKYVQDKTTMMLASNYVMDDK